MWVVKNSRGETVAVCSRKKDAEAMKNTSLDDNKDGPYTVEEN